MSRTAAIERNTKETQVKIALTLDGQGMAEIETGVPFFDHMLNQIARHGFFDLTVIAKGDLEIDAHHTVEDVGIALGEAFKQALGDKVGVRRYGKGAMPKHESAALGLDEATGRDSGIQGVRSTKGMLE